MKVLCLLNTEKGRDVEMLIPLLYFIEKYLSCDISFCLHWNIYYIHNEKPDIVIIPNTIGSLHHYQASKYAYKNGIKVFSLISEGNFRTDGTFNYWGWNKDKIFFQEFICLWSKRTLDFLAQEEPEHTSKMVLTGGVGFDRYKIYKFSSKEAFLKKYNLKSYTKIIGYAGWAFGKMYHPQGLKDLDTIGYSDKLDWLKTQMLEVRSILKKLIVDNPDILFILKNHPTEVNPTVNVHWENEITELKHLKNVLYLNRNEEIHTLISVSDIWMGFETTTCLEAWLMDKPETILINPEPDFNRDKLYKGSLIVKSYEELKKYVTEFYKINKIQDCRTEDLFKERGKLIRDTIGFSDGLNHLRAGYYFKKVVDNLKIDQKKKLKLDFTYKIRHLLFITGKLFYNKRIFEKLPKLKKHIWIFEEYQLKNIHYLKEKYYPYMDNFYSQKKIGEWIKDNSIWKEIIKPQ